MTVFNDFLNLLSLQVNIYHNSKVCGNWVISEHSLGATCFHIVTTGQCWLTVPGYLDTEFNRGDLVIFPKEIEHQMTSVGNQRGKQQHLDYQTDLSGTGMLCGEVSVLHLYRDQLIDALPPVLLIKNDKKTPWLNNIVNLLLQESHKGEQSNAVLINRLSELLFVFALRHYLENSEDKIGILALFADKKIAKALKLFHESLENKWDLKSLANKAGMSRTSFATKFKQISGWTVNQYTNWWRMQIAWKLLQSGNKVSVVSYQVGYLSEAAFSRAFKKQFKVSAGSVRRGK